MTDKCLKCRYWRPLISGQENGEKCCHYCIDNGRLRKRNGDECLSYEEIKAE